MTTEEMTQFTEAESMLIIRRPAWSRTWCLECAREVAVVVWEETSESAGIPRCVLRECFQRNGWHFTEAGDGSLVICMESLLDSTVVPRYAANDCAAA